MKLIILTVILIALCVFLLCFNIIFRKDGKFPDGEIEHNKELRKMGIQCAKIEEKRLWGKKGDKKRGQQDGKECNNDCGSCTIDC